MNALPAPAMNAIAAIGIAAKTMIRITSPFETASVSEAASGTSRGYPGTVAPSQAIGY